jgi:hypothetical protein
VLLLDELVDSLQVILNLGAVAVLGQLSTLSHLAHVVLKLANARSWGFLVVHVALGINLQVWRGGYCDIFVDWSLVQNLLAVVDKLLTKLFCKLVCLTALSGAVVHVVLHEVEKERV